MTTADIVILGGSAAGITAAITARRHHPNKNILLVRKEKQVPIPCGIPYIFGTLGVWSTAVGDLAMGTAGLTESMAKDRGYQVVCGAVETPDRHPGGMPGAAPMKVKLIFESHSQVLIGGQVRGGVSVGEMINAIAACVQKRMTAEDIAMFQMGTQTRTLLPE